MTLPEVAVRRFTDQTLVFAVTGTDDITHIDPMLPGQHVLFIFTESAATNGIVSGDNLLLADDFKWVAGDTLMIFSDGISWRQPSSADLNPPPVDLDFYQTVKDSAGSAQTPRAVLKFTGSLSVADAGGETVVTDADFNQTIKDPAGSASTQRSVLKFTGSGINSVSDVGGETVVDVSGGGSSFYQTVQDAGSDQAQRSKLDFVGFTVADDSGNDRTIITAPTDTDYYQQIKDPAGSSLTQRNVLKFVGSSISIADTGGETVVTVADSTPADGSITTAKLAASAVTTAPTSDTGADTSTLANNGTETVLVTKSFTVTGTGSVILISAHGTIAERVNGGSDIGWWFARLYEGSNKIAETHGGAAIGVGTYYLPFSMVKAITGLSAGAHTFELRATNAQIAASPDGFSRGGVVAFEMDIIELKK